MQLKFPRLSFQHAFPFTYGHKLYNESKFEGSKCNPNFQGSTSNTFFFSTYGHKLFSRSRLDFSQPHFGGSVRSPFTFPKMGLESPLGLPKTQDSMAEVKTPCIEVFFIPLERF